MDNYRIAENELGEYMLQLQEQKSMLHRQYNVEQRRHTFAIFENKDDAINQIKSLRKKEKEKEKRANVTEVYDI